MVNRPKAKGTAGETAVVKYSQANGFPLSDRLTLSGRFDRGDVQLTIGVIIEVKTGNHAKTASLGQINLWLEETERERKNAKANLGFLVKQRTGFGIGRVEQWEAWFIRGSDILNTAEDQIILDFPIAMTLEHALVAIRRSGWGEPITQGDAA